MFLIALTMIFCATTFAQQPSQQQRLSREQLAEKEARHIAQALAFSDGVTDKFITTYCNYQKEIWALKPRQRQQRKAQSEQDSEKRIQQRFARSEKILSIREKYYKEYSKFLTQAQIEKVYEQERKMIKRHAAKRARRQAKRR